MRTLLFGFSLLVLGALADQQAVWAATGCFSTETSGREATMIYQGRAPSEPFHGQSGSVFTVCRDGRVLPGGADFKPNDQSFDLAVIEFDDNGFLASAGQLEAALGRIRKARLDNHPHGAVIVVFVHGWYRTGEQMN